MKRKYTNCDNCGKNGNHYYSDKHQVPLCDLCLGLPPAKQHAIKEHDGPVALEAAIAMKFENIYGQLKGDKMGSVKFYGDYDAVTKRLDELRTEYEKRSGAALNNLKQTHQNRRSDLIKAQLKLDVAQAASDEATSAYKTEQLELEKLEHVIDDLSIQKKALYKGPVKSVTGPILADLD